ncbi:hypothetical protein PQX77_007367 [Marasmius sp. AFHP31]|nr:hypothetical protein PQX77_007367 [Marasmius sp. AFHP31]
MVRQWAFSPLLCLNPQKDSVTDSRSSTTGYRCVQCGHEVELQRNGHIQASQLLDRFSKDNEHPSPSQLEALRKEYEETFLIYGALDATIQQLQASLEDAKRQSGILKTRLTAYKSAMNPIRRLPNEIVGYIFRLGVDADVDPTTLMSRLGRNQLFPSTLDTKRLPWTLGQVCRRWRRLAISLPDLWTTIDINWDGILMGERAQLFLERRLSLFLQRSSDRPLSISWYQDSCLDRVLLSMLCSVSFRWKAATIRTGTKGLRQLSVYSGLFSNLARLHLHFEEGMLLEQGETDAPFSTFRTAPALRELSLFGNDDSIPHRLNTQIPWHQITRFSVKDFSPINIRTILPLLVNVEECILDSFDHSGGSLTLSPTILPHLHLLYVYPPTVDAAMSFFQSLTLPKLRSVELGIFDGPAGIADSFVQLLERSSCQLEKASLYYLDEVDLVRVLQSPRMHYVNTMDLCGSYLDDGSSPHYDGVSDEVLHILSLPLPNDDRAMCMILPHLRSLTLSGSTQWTDAALVKMLASRRRIDHLSTGSVSRLEKVGLDLEGESYRELIQDEWARTLLDTLRVEGLGVFNGANGANNA